MQSASEKRSRPSRHLGVTAVGLAAGLMALAGAAVAAPTRTLILPWLGGAGGRAGTETLALEAAIGQSAAGLSGNTSLRLCAGAACPEGTIAGPHTPTPSSIHLPIAWRPAPSECLANGGGAITQQGQSRHGVSDDRISQPEPEALVVDHDAVADFLGLEPDQIAAAASLRMLFIDHSVGQNISDGLDCTASDSVEAAPNRCRRFEHVVPLLSADPALFRFGPEYDRSRWSYHAGGSSYWKEWPDYVDSVLADRAGDWDVVIPMPSYLVAPNGGWEPIESLEAAHPDVTFVYATSSLPRGAAGGTAGDLVMQRFNSDARAYALAHEKPLLDVADILGHDYDGNPCFDTRDGVEYCQTADRCENLPDDGVAIPAICQHYTSELHGGHLGSVSGGALRMAQAVWVLMARLTEDELAPPETPASSPTVEPSPEATRTGTAEPPDTPGVTDTPIASVTTTATAAAEWAIYVPRASRV